MSDIAPLVCGIDAIPWCAESMRSLARTATRLGGSGVDIGGGVNPRQQPERLREQVQL